MHQQKTGRITEQAALKDVGYVSEGLIDRPYADNVEVDGWNEEGKKYAEHYLPLARKEQALPKENDHKGNHYYEEPKDVFNNISTIHPNKLDDDKDILNESFFEGNKEEMLNLDLVSYCVQQYSSKKKDIQGSGGSTHPLMKGLIV